MPPPESAPPSFGAVPATGLTPALRVFPFPGSDGPNRRELGSLIIPASAQPLRLVFYAEDRPRPEAAVDLQFPTRIPLGTGRDLCIEAYQAGVVPPRPAAPASPPAAAAPLRVRTRSRGR